MLTPDFTGAVVPSSHSFQRHRVSYPQQHQTPQHQSSQRRRASETNFVRCNLCRKPLSACVFVLSCNCMFCEGTFTAADSKYICVLAQFAFLTHFFPSSRSFLVLAGCTYSHFNKNTSCPSCNKTMGEDDFSELTILDPPSSIKWKESMYKRSFVKMDPNAKSLNTHDLWARIQRQHAMARSGTKFFLHQIMKENSTQIRRVGQIQHALKLLKEDNGALKREINKHKEKIEAYQQELIKANKKIEDRDQQLAQFRKMFESRGGPPSSGSSFRGDSQRHHPGGAVTARQSSLDGKRPAPTQRPRRVSDQHAPFSSAQDSGYAQDRRTPNAYSAPQGRSNPYEQATPRHGMQPHPARNHYNGNAASRQPSSQQQRHPHNNNHSQQPYSHAGLQNSYQKPPSAFMVPSSQPGTLHHPSSSQQRQRQQRQRQHQPPPSYYPSGGSVSSFRSQGSGSASGGGKIRHITASTGYSFSGSASNDGESGRDRSKPSSSPSHGFPGTTPTTNHPNPYHSSHHRQRQQHPVSTRRTSQPYPPMSY